MLLTMWCGFEVLFWGLLGFGALCGVGIIYYSVGSGFGGLSLGLGRVMCLGV